MSQDKRVSDVMTMLDKVYMLEASVRLNFDRMLEIYRSGYTRVPIYEGHKQNIVGILYTKDLILVDPDDELEIQTVISLHGKAHVQYILDITPLDEVRLPLLRCMQDGNAIHQLEVLVSRIDLHLKRHHPHQIFLILYPLLPPCNDLSGQQFMTCCG